MTWLHSVTYSFVSSVDTASYYPTLHWLTLHYTALHYIRGQFRDLEPITNRLLDTCLSVLSSDILPVYKDNDDITKECLLLLRDVAEIQLPYMSIHTAKLLYQTSLQAFQIFSYRFQQTTSALALTQSTNSSHHHQLHTGVTIESENEYVSFESDFKNDILLYSLQLLNHLVTKDLLLDDTNTTTHHNYANGNGSASLAAANVLIPQVLLSGLEIVVSVITPELLRNYSATADRYFTFLSLLVSSYEQELAVRVAHSTAAGVLTGGGNVDLLKMMMQHILWAAGAVDSTCARLALQVLYCSHSLI